MAVNGFSQLEALKRQVNGSIDGIQKAIELLPFWDDLNGSWTFELVTPIGYLLQLAQALDIMDEVKDFLAKTITWSLPAIEVGVKGIILANLTQCLSCSTHPFIPDYMRSMYYKETFNVSAPTLETKVVEKTVEGEGEDDKKTKKKVEFILNKGEFSFEQTPVFGSGVTIPESSIDYDNMLSHSPFAKWDKKHEFVDYSEMYFGTTDPKDKEKKLSPFMMARAEDCNAYLWFVKNRGYFKDVVNVSTPSDVTKEKDTHLLGFISIPNGSVGGSLKKVTNGTGVRYTDSMSLSIVSDVQFDDSGNATEMKLLPVSSNSTNTNKPSINWYCNSELAWTNNLTEYSKKARDYTKDRPIYSLTYSGGNFTFKILPKPLIHYPIMISRGQEEKYLDGSTYPCEDGWNEKLTQAKKILFDEKGKPQKTSMKGGRFTVSPVINGKKIERLRVSHDNHDYVYRLYKAKDVFSGTPVSPTPGEPEVVLYYTQEGNYSLRKYNNSTGSLEPAGSVIPDELLAKYLYECYPGLTIYQFNYDYIMGMRLFDSNVIMTRLMNQLFNLNVDTKITADQIAAREEIREMVRRVINSSEQTDNCFFSFSNDEINRLTQDAINKRKNPHTHIGNTQLDDESIEMLQSAMQGVFNSSNKGGQKDAVNSAIDAGIATATKFIPSETKYGASATFLEDLCVELILQIVLNSLMTPKVAMLLQVNKELMGQSATLDVNFETLLKSMINLIYSIVKEIVTMLLQELFELIMAKLEEVLAMFGVAVLTEYLDYYTELIKEIITQCGFRIGMGNNNSGIDNVNYADIDEATSTPSPDNC